MPDIANDIIIAVLMHAGVAVAKRFQSSRLNAQQIREYPRVHKGNLIACDVNPHGAELREVIEHRVVQGDENAISISVQPVAEFAHRSGIRESDRVASPRSKADLCRPRLT